MNVTTKKSECDPRQRIRQLEVAIEHAQTAAATHSDNGASAVSAGSVEISYPSFEFRETLKRLRPDAGSDGACRVIDLGPSTIEACKAARTVLGHYYPDESFVVGVVPVAR